MSGGEIVFGGVEGGGTNFVILVGSGPDHIIDEARFDTTTPDETLGKVIDFLGKPRPNVTLAAVGVSSFGPVDLDLASPTYGYITTTPKPHWLQTPVATTLRDALGVPVGFDTDTNGAALGERRWGAGKGYDPLLYITVGTGIGGGILNGNVPVHGLLHPEVGHLPMPSYKGDAFEGWCKFHGRCLEGLASGPAIRKRAGRPAEQVDPSDPLWDGVAFYLAVGVMSMVLVASPKRVIIGGGVSTVPGLLDRLRTHMLELNDGYIDKPEFTPEGIKDYVIPPGVRVPSLVTGELMNRSGAIGAIELARDAYEAAGAAAALSL